MTADQQTRVLGDARLKHGKYRHTIAIAAPKSGTAMHSVRALIVPRQFSYIQDAFVSRMRPGLRDPGSKSPLLRLVDDTIVEILQLDHDGDNSSGREMIERMVQFFNRPPPPKHYNNMEEFLLYRHEDAAVPCAYSPFISKHYIP